MSSIGDLTILVPIDVSEPEAPSLAVLDILGPIEVVLLGYFPVPDQAEPALIKHEYEEAASARLDALAHGRAALTEVLVYTHDREATIDRVADEHNCDAVLTAGDTDRLDRILVPLRGDVNLERIVSVVAGLSRASGSTVTFFHLVAEDADPSRGQFLLRGATDRLVDLGIEADRIDHQLVEGQDPHAAIVDIAKDYDLVVLGETEPSLRERIIGDVLSRIIDDIDVPALIVRDVE